MCLQPEKPRLFRDASCIAKYIFWRDVLSIRNVAFSFHIHFVSAKITQNAASKRFAQSRW